MHMPTWRRDRRGWIAVGLIVMLVSLALLGRWDWRSRSDQPERRRAVAQAGDSVLSVARLRAYLDSREDSLTREELERWLDGWVEDQILAQEAHRLGLDTLAHVREELGRLRLRYLRGLLEEQALAETLSVSQLELRTWARANEDLLAQPERQLDLDWYSGQDSLLLSELAGLLRRGRMKFPLPDSLGVLKGRTGWTALDELPRAHGPALEGLDLQEWSPVLPVPGGWILYQVQGQRPVGWLPDADQDEAMVREAMMQDLRHKRLESRLEALRQEAVWKVDLEPLIEVESGVPPSRDR